MHEQKLVETLVLIVFDYYIFCLMVLCCNGKPLAKASLFTGCSKILSNTILGSVSKDSLNQCRRIIGFVCFNTTNNLYYRNLNLFWFCALGSHCYLSQLLFIEHIILLLFKWFNSTISFVY